MRKVKDNTTPINDDDKEIFVKENKNAKRNA